MIDAAGPWGTGAFTLVEGYSSLDDERATIRKEPLAATWLILREDRTPGCAWSPIPNTGTRPGART